MIVPAVLPRGSLKPRNRLQGREDRDVGGKNKNWENIPNSPDKLGLEEPQVPL